jgi:adenine deaminase
LDVAVVDGVVAGLGDGYRGRRREELGGRWILPGFIDAHVHIESSLATPAEFARAVLPRGTTTVISDPHEIANVHGLEGIRWMLSASEDLPLSVLVMASSCVPATAMGTAGSVLDADALSELATHPRVLGLAEVMNFPGVIQGDPDMLEKLVRFEGPFRNGAIDGHAPGVRGKLLNAYTAAGPASDHECTTPEEAAEKLRRGLFVLLREATNAHNLRDLLPALTSTNARRMALCTDDRQPPDLLDEGGIDAMLRTVMAAGVEPVEAVRLATLNPATHFGLRDRGAVAPGRRADLVVLASDLPDLAVERVWAGGREVAREGETLEWEARTPPPPPPSMAVELDDDVFRIPGRAGGRARVVGVVEDQIVTRSLEAAPTLHGGEVVADPERDLLKIAVVERHRGSGRVGVGLVQGMGLRRGALAGTVAHDHHNLIVIGADDTAMGTAARAVAALGGGLAVADGTEVTATLPLPVAGLMSTLPIQEVREALDAVVAAARDLGSPLHDPFMAMSFLGLEVIPSLKITDRGLVDVDAFRLVDLWL